MNNPSRSLFLLFFLLAATLPACVRPPADAGRALPSIQDLATLPQDPAHYAARLPREQREQPLADATAQRAMQERYLKLFFDPWRRTAAKATASEAFWGITDYVNQQGYGENKLPRDKAWMDALVAASDAGRYPRLAYKAVAARNTALRAMPTQRPFFLDFEKAGEGYPFDYFQNSAVWAGTPLFVAHATPAGDWLFVETGYASGWIPANDLARVDEAFIAAYQTGEYAVIRKDETPLADAQGRVLFATHLGALFPLAPPVRRKTGAEGDLELLVPVSDAAGKAELRRCRVREEDAVRGFLPLTAANVADVAAGMMGQPYGWGGLYENRDCSATLRDLFALFGVWLPRNSGAQAQEGRVLQLKDLDPAVKGRVIIEKGVPFATLLGLKGHIVLYLGAHQGQAVVFHNVWGVRTLDADNREGRRILGRTVITTLEPGKEHEDVRRAARSLLRGVRTMSILGQ